jgi:WhiB family transcriptional regulator, redox-sensing transcriptional regulator
MERDTDFGEGWRAYAACRFVDPELFFPSGDKSEAALASIEAAKQVCAICVVRVPCLEFALENREGDGIWGGATEEERRRILRQRRRLAG